MSTSPFRAVIQHLQADPRPQGNGATDGELLVRFLRSRDADALAALVQRHAAMVWGVCRRFLSHHEAEDAFQATFLVLIRKAADAPRHAVANWLYGVARQTAVRLRATAAKRGRREVQMPTMPEPAAPEIRDAELQVVVDEELSRLPGRYRSVIVLCDLEGMTRKEAARQIGIPEGSVASRLARARALLARRLARRDAAFLGSVGAALSARTACVSAPPILVTSTIQAATMLASGQTAATAVVSVRVVSLAEGVVKVMMVSKLKAVMAVVLLLGFIAGGTTVVTGRMPAAQGDQRAAQEGRAELPKNKETPASKPEPLMKDLSKIEPPGGAPLPITKPGTNELGVAELNKVRKRMQAVPPEELEKWLLELERIMGEKLEDGLPSPRQECRTDFAIRMSVAFDDLKWNARAADSLYERACTMPASEARAWKAAFETTLRKEIGVKKLGDGKFTNLKGGPSWAVPLVLIPVDALHKGGKYSVERGKKYLARLEQLTAEDVSLWRNKVDRFDGSDLDAAVNIILLDGFFKKEVFQRDSFKAAVAAQQEKEKTRPKDDELGRPAKGPSPEPRK